MPPFPRLVVGPPLPASLQDVLTSTSTAYPPVPGIEELAAYSSAIAALQAAAEDRAAKCKEAVKTQREVIARVEKRADEEKKGREKEKERVEKDRVRREDSVRKEGEKFKTEEERRRKERDRNGTTSPTVRVKRELSASPAPTTNGDYSALQQPSRIKKRKLEHPGSTASPETTGRQELPGLSGSRLQSPASERPSLTPSLSTLKVKLKVTGDAAPSKLGRPSASLQQTDFTPPPAHPTINFSLPSTSVRPLVPPRPAIPPPPKPGPKRQKDVNEDFSHSKQHNNPVQLGTFWTAVEHYLRDVSEDDLAMLGFRANDPEPFNIPALGRHYQEVWDEEDAHIPFGIQSNATASSSAVTQDVLPPRGKRMANRPPRFVPARDMTDEDLTDDLKGLGGVAERILGAMFPVQQDRTDRRHSPSKLPAANGEETTSGLVTSSSTMANGSTSVNGTSGGDHPPVVSAVNPATTTSTYEWPIQPRRIPNRTGDKDRASCAQVDMNELEEGLKREMKHLGLISPDEDVDFTMRQDDEITASLRQCQRLLRQQLAVNDARKNRLADAARDRLAYGDYKHTLSGLEAVITTAWQRRSSRKVRKGKSKDKEKEKEDVYVIGKKMPGSALPEQVKKAMEARRKWIDSVGVAFEGEETAGRFKDLPTRSIYEGVDDQCREERIEGE